MAQDTAERRRRVLLVEDEGPTSALMKQELASSGCEVYAVSTGGDAVAASSQGE